MTARSLLLGLDGADLNVIRDMGAARLPVLHRLMERGIYAASRSVQPPATLPNWTTLLTGVDPGTHGVFDFTTRVGYRVRFTAGTVREVPTFMTTLDREGLQCACIGFPATWPPERLNHGVFISGWDAPVAFESDASFVWPTSLHQEIVERFGPQRFDDVDELNADAPGWHERLPTALCERIERKLELARFLLDSRDWDVFAFYFGESDTASHHLWALHDPRSPRHPGSGLPSDGLARVLQNLDTAVGTLLADAGGDSVEVTIVSDHGFGGASDKVLYLNRVLAASGFLRFRSARRRQQGVHALKQIALRSFPPKLREQVFRVAGATLPGWLESQARFGAIDMSRTRAFSEELNYFPAISWNLRGREPDGVLEPRDVARTQAELTHALLSLRDPWSGNAVVAAVHSREDLFRGPHVERAPDLLLELNLDDGYSYNLMPSPLDSGAHSLPFRRLAADEWLGRKGRSLAGSHRPNGVAILAGPQVAATGQVPAHIADVTATLLSRIRALQKGNAQQLHKMVQASEHSMGAPTITKAAPLDASGESRVETRLRALGYIE